MPLPDLFPNAGPDDIRVTSEFDPGYNCVAWALGENDRWWEPYTYYWPDGVPRTGTVEAYCEIFAQVGYEPCPDAALEDGFEKVAIYGSPSGEFEHVALQLPNGRWTSKLGYREDIDHATLEVIEGACGRVAAVMRRRRRAPGAGS